MVHVNVVTGVGGSSICCIFRMYFYIFFILDNVYIVVVVHKK